MKDSFIKKGGVNPPPPKDAKPSPPPPPTKPKKCSNCQCQNKVEEQDVKATILQRENPLNGSDIGNVSYSVDCSYPIPLDFYWPYDFEFVQVASRIAEYAIYDYAKRYDNDLEGSEIEVFLDCLSLGVFRVKVIREFELEQVSSERNSNSQSIYKNR